MSLLKTIKALVVLTAIPVATFAQTYSYTCGIKGKGGTVTLGSNAAGNVTAGKDQVINIYPKKGYTIDRLYVQHGEQTDEIDGLFFRSTRSFTLPGRYVDGDMVITARFVPEEAFEWKPIFSDDFDQGNGYAAIDTTKWQHCWRETAAWNRYVAMTDEERELVTYLEDGELVLRSIKNPFTATDNVEMITGGLKTLGKWDYRFGYAEARMKTTKHTGNFPAFWMMPTYNEDGWPHHGEIDVFETIDTQDKAWHTIHSHWANSAGDAAGCLNRTTPTKGYNHACTVEEYHTYGVWRTPAFMRWYVDGKAVFEYRCLIEDDFAMGEGRQWPFNEPFYLMVNQSVGMGTWAAKPDVNFEYESRVDYIKVWERSLKPEYETDDYEEPIDDTERNVSDDLMTEAQALQQLHGVGFPLSSEADYMNYLLESAKTDNDVKAAMDDYRGCTNIQYPEDGKFYMWTFVDPNGGYWRMQSTSTGYKLVKYNHVSLYGKHGTEAEDADCNDAFKWKFTRLEDGTYYVQNSAGKYMGYHGTKDCDGTGGLDTKPHAWTIGKAVTGDYTQSAESNADFFAMFHPSVEFNSQTRYFSWNHTASKWDQSFKPFYNTNYTSTVIFTEVRPWAGYIEDSTGNVEAATRTQNTIYDVQGRQVSQPLKHNIYVTNNGQKVIY